MKKLYLRFYYSLLLLLLSPWVQSQSFTYLTVPVAANGTSGAGRGPLNTVNAHRSCAIYSAAEFSGLLNAGDSIFRLGFSVNNPNANAAPIAGSIKIYMVNTADAAYLRSTTWGTLLTTPTAMDTNYNGPMSIPNVITNFFVPLSKPFVYTGGGVYVAYEWTTSTPSTNPIVYNCNTAIVSGQRNIQGASLATLGTLTGISSFRAQLVIGVKTPQVDAQVLEVYSLGKLPIPFAAPHTVRANVRNGGTDTLYDKWFYLTVGPTNPLIDSLKLDTILPNQGRTINFPAYTPTAIGFDTVKVFCTADNNNSNNLKRYGQAVNLNTYNYADPLRGPNGGVGFTGGTGDFVAKFPYTGSNSINQIGVNFNTGGTSLKVGIWDTTATGTPGALLWSSTNFLTLAGLNTIPVNPPIPISGTFFVGVIQTGTVNAAFSFQSEVPIRAQTFYYTAPSGGTVWTDFLATNSNFRFMIEPRLQMANDLGATEISAPCNSFPIGQGSIIPAATFYNYGSNTQFTTKVRARIFNDANAVVYNDSSVLSFILPGTSENVVFTNSFTPTLPGNYTVKIWSELSGDGDKNNDTATKSIIVQNLTPGTSAGFRLQLDGIDDFISIPHSANTQPNNNFTIETWVRPSNLISVGTIYSKDSLNSDTSLTITLSGLTPVVSIKTNNAFLNLSSSVNTILNSWSHVALTYDGTNLKLYVNGELGIDTTLTGSVNAKMGPTYLGRKAGVSNSLSAGIENFVFWNIARTESAIRLGLHRKLPALSNPNITCYLRFDEGANSVPLSDASGNCNGGQMNNFDPAVAWFISSLPLDTVNGTQVTFTSSGVQSFAGKNINMNFQNLSGSINVVAHYIRETPLGFLPDTVITSSPKTGHNRYWILYSYGNATYDSCLATFQLPAGNIGTGASNSDFYLANRDNGASGLWNLARNPADSVNILGQTLRFWLPSTGTFVKQYGLASTGTNNPLPVIYAYFKGVKQDNSVALNWATASEINSAYFELERSVDGKNFSGIGKIEAAGNSVKSNFYNYLDKDALQLGAKALYYRLNQVDLDGNNEYSPVIIIHLDEQKAITVQSVMPNPFKNNLEINFAAATELNMEVQVSNLKGEIMFTKTLNTEAGMQKINLAEAETLAEGIYFLKITTNGISEVHKLVKVKN
jgi:hypothetical protein